MSNRTTIERPLGSNGVELQQQAITNFLLVTAPPGAPLPVDLKMYLNAPCGPLNPIDVEDTGLNTNPARYLQIWHWDSGTELVLNAAAAVNLGAAVGAGLMRRIREITVRNAAQANTVITLSVGGVNRLSFDVPAQTTRTWSSEDGRAFVAASQPQIASSAAAGGSETYITASGIEAAPT